MNQVTENLIGVALVDDELSIRESAAVHLKRQGYQVRSFASAEDCLQSFRDKPADVVITDLRMPGMNGIDLLRAVKQQVPSTEVVIITAHADKETAIEALRLGAFDFFEKPFSLAELSETIKRTVRYQSALRERDQLAERVSVLAARDMQQWGLDAMVGKTPVLRTIVEDIRKLQDADTTSVLITGESGTGKELVARAIHYGSTRAPFPFIPVNCSAVPGELAESELFGHVRGSFTGAATDRKGCFERADKGTLFLDEIGDMSALLQTKLLRVLEDGIVTPVGGSRGVQTHVRILAATNANLNDRLQAGNFRRDLFFRLARFTIHLPPLRERRADIPLLVDHFLKKLSSEMGLACPTMDASALAMLDTYTFPGNIRELRNIMERALIQSGGKTIRQEHLYLQRMAPATQSTVCTGEQHEHPVETIPTSLNIAENEKTLIRKALEVSNGNMASAARLLGINRTKLYRKMHTA